MRLANILAALSLAATAVPSLAQASARPVIRTEADLPQKLYKLDDIPSVAFLGADFDRRIVPQLKVDAEAILARYQIDNAEIRTRLQIGLAAIAVLQGDARAAERWISLERDAQTKPQLRMIGYLNREAAAAALAAPAGQGCEAAAGRISSRLASADPAIVREEAILRYGQSLAISEPYLGANVVFDHDPRAKSLGGLALMHMLQLAMWRADIRTIPPCREQIVAAWRNWVIDPAHQPRDIWPDRQPDPARFVGTRPVTVAIWDTGIDTSLFPGQMAIDPAEPLDGKDNDGNGVIDDVNGPTYDGYMRPSPTSLPVLSDFLRPQLSFQQALVKGQADLDYGLDTPEARLMGQRGREASLDDQAGDIDAINELFERSHGTFVASQVADGAPWVKLYLARALTGGFNPKPISRAEPEADRWLAALPAMIARMRGAGVRVVNMSWTVVADAMASELMANGLETDPARAQARAKAIHGKVRKGLTEAIRSAPDILFVAAAGNNNQTDDSFQALPQSLDLPNLIVVGAVSRAGTPAAFTTFGKSVRLYAPGDGVRGRVPGGGEMLGSGTSYASPVVARVAAAMLAVNPGLKPEEVIAGLIATATPGEGQIALIHPAAATDWAARRK